MYRGKPFISLLLLTVFIGYYSCITLLVHVHDVDGCKTVHAHPLSNYGGEDTHTHTEKECGTIELLSLLQLQNNDTHFNFTAYTPTVPTVYGLITVVPELPTVSHFLLRGPPLG